MPRLALGCFLAWIALLGTAPCATGQAMPGGPASAPIHLEANDTPLADILRELASQARIDVVFAERTVQGKAVTGRYIGDDPEGALRTVLRGSGLVAERVRPRQYVIVPEQLDPLLEPVTQRRGTLDGTVVDAATGEVLPGAHVVIAGLELGTVTNAAGYFALPGLPIGTYRLRVSYVGYKAVEVELTSYPASRVERPVIRLMPQPIVSAPVMVEGRDGERGDLEIVPGTSVVAVRAAEAMPAFLGEGDVVAALEWLPGVTRAGEAGGELIVRGAEAQYNRYLLDGAPVIHPWHTFGLFSTFQPEALKSVRLHRGSLPAEYGGGLSAVLDLEMRDGERGGSSGIIAVSPVAIRGVAEAPLGNGVSLMLTARRTWLDLFLEPRLRLGSSGGLPAFQFDTPRLAGNGSEDQEVGYHFYDLGAKVTWRVADGQRLSLSVYDGSDRLTAASPFAALFTGAPGSTYADAAVDDTLRLDLGYRWGNQVVSARYRGLVAPDLFVTATGYYSGYRARERAFARPSAIASMEREYRLRFAEAGLRVDADYYHSLEHQLRAGVHFIGRDFASTLFEEQRRSESFIERLNQFDSVRALEIAGYVQDTWQPSPELQLQPGLRVEIFGLGGYLSVNPRFHLRYALARDELFFRAGLGRQTQYIHRLHDRHAFTYDLASDRWIPASERVRPASAWQVATGVEWIPRRWLTLGVEAFARQLSDILLSAESMGGSVSAQEPGYASQALLDQYVAGSGRAFGLEWTAEAEYGRWRTGLSYSLSRTLERTPGIPYRPARYDAPHHLEAFVLGGGGPWTASVAASLRSGYPATTPTALYVLDDPIDGEGGIVLHYPEIHNGRLPLYTRVDASVTYAFRLAGLQWDAQAQAYNLLNRRNTVGIQYGSAATAVSATDIAGLPILPMLSLRARW
jgi:hypothetical protein